MQMLMISWLRSVLRLVVDLLVFEYCLISPFPIQVIGEVDRVREALVQIVLRLRDDVLKERDGPHGALSSDSLFSGGPRANSNADSLYSGSSRNAPVADSLYSSALRSAPSDSLYSGGIALPSALSSIPPITPLSYDQRIESGSSLGRLSVGSLYGYGSLQVLFIQKYPQATASYCFYLGSCLMLFQVTNIQMLTYQMKFKN